jgi:hypothetical protein
MYLNNHKIKALAPLFKEINNAKLTSLKKKKEEEKKENKIMIIINLN